ncbi:MAG: hypothetical protein DRP30_05940 [Thermotoga sp.]|nr:MAG: hypothetical protein DRP30_05940 [Thermotoga sp.]
MKVVSIRLTPEELKILDAVAKELDVSRSWVIRKLINNFIEDLYDGEFAKRRLLNAEWVDHEEVKQRFLAHKVGEKSSQGAGRVT